MQLEVYNPTEGQELPQISWNFPALKEWLADGLSAYKGRIYDEKDIGKAKKDAATLRKLKTAINGKRMELKTFYLEPYEKFAAQTKELTDMIDEQVSEIAAQINVYDEARKAEKLEHIKEKYAEIMGDLAALVPFEKIKNPKWLNVTYSMSSIEDEITEKAESVRAALASIDALGLPDDVAGRVKSVYLDRLDLPAALAEKERMERERQALEDYEAAQKKAAQAPQNVPHEALGYAADEAPDLVTVDFRIHATREQLAALKAFLLDNNIQYGPVPKK